VQALTVPDGSVTTAKIADGAVTQAKLGSDVSLEPADGSVTTAKIADGAVTSAKLEHSGPHIPITPDENGLVKTAVMRQDDTADTYSKNQVILTGWGWKAGTGGDWMSESVSFGVTFSDTPIVVISGAGEITTKNPTSLEDFGVASNLVATTAFISTTGFTAVFKMLNEANIPPSSRVGYTWIAIGTLE
jgi:hypothetical protein